MWIKITSAIDVYVLGQDFPADSQTQDIAARLFIRQAPPYTSMSHFRGAVVTWSSLPDLLAFPAGVFWQRVFSIIKKAKSRRDAAGVAGAGSSGGSSGGSGSSGGK